MAATSQTVVYDELYTTTLNNYRKQLEDNISLTNSVWWFLKNKVKDGMIEVDDIGNQMEIGLRYANGDMDTYAGYDPLSTAPTAGITAAFFPWFQAATPITISGEERIKNKGESRKINLLETKTSQAEDGIKEGLSKMIMQGLGKIQPTTAGAIALRYRSVNNLSYGPNPLFDLVRVDPTTSTTIGGINQSDEAWWRNYTLTASGITTYKQFLAKLRTFHRKLTEYNTAGPDMYLTDGTTWEMYETALSEFHQNPSYQSADIPFDAVQFKKKPMMWDSNFPQDAAAGLATDASNPTGSILGLDLKKLQIQIVKERNFKNTEFQVPVGQDAMVSQILLMAGMGTSNRRNQGVLHSIPVSLT